MTLPLPLPWVPTTLYFDSLLRRRRRLLLQLSSNLDFFIKNVFALKITQNGVGRGVIVA